MKLRIAAVLGAALLGGCTRAPTTDVKAGDREADEVVPEVVFCKIPPKNLPPGAIPFAAALDLPGDVFYFTPGFEDGDVIASLFAAECEQRGGSEVTPAPSTAVFLGYNAVSVPEENP